MKLHSPCIYITNVGGGFGGKESRCDVPYSAVAVAAKKLVQLLL